MDKQVHTSAEHNNDPSSISIRIQLSMKLVLARYHRFANTSDHRVTKERRIDRDSEIKSNEITLDLFSDQSYRLMNAIDTNH